MSGDGISLDVPSVVMDRGIRSSQLRVKQSAEVFIVLHRTTVVTTAAISAVTDLRLRPDSVPAAGLQLVNRVVDGSAPARAGDPAAHDDLASGFDAGDPAPSEPADGDRSRAVPQVGLKDRHAG